MFVQRLVFAPALGKFPDLRALLTERVKQRQAEGVDAALAVAIDPTPDGAWFAMNIRHADLAALEAFRDRNAADAGFQAWNAKLVPLLGRNPAGDISETLSVPPPGGPVRFIQRITFRPAPGRLPELRAMQMERVKQRQADGARVGLAVTLGGEEGSETIFFALHASLKDFEATRQKLGADPAAQLFVQRISTLMTRPPRVTLAEILVPFKP